MKLSFHTTILLVVNVIFVNLAFAESIAHRTDLPLTVIELKNGKKVEIKSAVKTGENHLLVTLPNGREGKVHRHKLSVAEEKRRFGNVLPRGGESSRQELAAASVPLELANGKTVKAVFARRIDADTLFIKLESGKSGRIPRSKLSLKEQMRCLGPLPPPSPVGKLEVVKSELDADFNIGKFVSGFKVRCKDLQEDIFFSPTYAMPYRYFVPEGVIPGIKVPLVVFLHGVGEGGTDNRTQLSRHQQPMVFVQPENQTRYPCFFMAPQLNEKGPWCSASLAKPTTEMQLVVDIIDDMIERYPAIDENRIYITGLSSGGNGAFEALARFPGKFAGAVPVSAGWPLGTTITRHRQHVAVWAFYNTDEGQAMRDQCDELMEKTASLGGIARATSFKAKRVRKHHAWKWAYAEPDLIPWLFSHRRKTGETRN